MNADSAMYTIGNYFCILCSIFEKVSLLFYIKLGMIQWISKANDYRISK